MSWTFKEPNIIENVAGHQIELKDGTWREPSQIDPRIKGVSALEYAQLVREGLSFARHAKPMSQAKAKPRAKPIKSAPTRPVLSLRSKTKETEPTT